jgi:2-dehydro-3-deoxygluconokinase
MSLAPNWICGDAATSRSKSIHAVVSVKGLVSFLKRTSKPPRIVGIGEAMVEFAPVPGGLFKQGFAGDTLNTCWYLRRMLPDIYDVAYVTRVGNDTVSNEFIAFLKGAGILTDTVSRDPERTLGLYTISLEGAERRFSYWREASAARRLADDAEHLAKVLSDAALVYISGITLAVIGERGRENLRTVLAGIKKTGGRVAFDSNIRLRLWRDAVQARTAIEEFVALSDIVLPSFDDEANLWDDSSPEATAARLEKNGAREIVVKNGAGGVIVHADGAAKSVSARPIQDIADTTAAGDSFNAAYLAARCIGYDPAAACEFGHALAGEIVRHRGALAPREAVEPVRQALIEKK